MFAFFPYMQMPVGVPAAHTTTAAVPCPTMPTFFSYPPQPTPIFLHPSPAMMSSAPSSASSSISPPSVQPSPPFLLYASPPMLPSPPVVFSASPPSAMVIAASTSPPNHATMASRRLPYLQPSPSNSTSPSTSPRSVVAPPASSSHRGEPVAARAATAPIPIPIPKAPATRGGQHGPNCTCFVGSGGGGGASSAKGGSAELSLTVLATTRKEQRDPAYAEKLERYRNKMRRTAPVADPQRSLLASKRKRDAMGKFLKEQGDGGIGRRTSARIEEVKMGEGDDDQPGVGHMQERDQTHTQRRQELRRGEEANGAERTGEAAKNEEERRRREGDESSPRTRVDFLLN